MLDRAALRAGLVNVAPDLRGRWNQDAELWVTVRRNRLQERLQSQTTSWRLQHTLLYWDYDDRLTPKCALTFTRPT